MSLSKPNATVQIPEGFVEGIKEATCSVVDSAVLNNPGQVTAELCVELRELYADDCGCMPFEGPTAAPSVRLPPERVDGACSVCIPGKEIRKPDTVVAIPEGFISDEITFATCDLLERALLANPDEVDDELCQSVREFYKEPCRCRDKKPDEENDPEPTMAPDTSSGSSRCFSLTVSVTTMFLLL